MELWDDLAKRGTNAIEDIRNKSLGESQQLEFKQKQKPDRVEPDSDDKKNFGSVICFQQCDRWNTDLGIATSNKSDETVATDLARIADPKRFAQNLENPVPQYLSPPNLNVQILPIFERSNCRFSELWIAVEIVHIKDRSNVL